MSIFYQLVAYQKRIGSGDSYDGQWHHMCSTWDNADASIEIYKDGTKVESHAQSSTKGSVIYPEGVLVLGRHQPDPTVSMDSFAGFEAFLGDLSDVNMWNRKLSGDEISAMSSECHSAEGNALQWTDFKSGVKGEAKVVEPSSCQP